MSKTPTKKAAKPAAKKSAAKPKRDVAGGEVKAKPKRDVVGGAEAPEPKKAPTSARAAPGSNSGGDEAAERAFGARFRELFDELQEIKSDLKELRQEAKAEGVDYRTVERAVRMATMTQDEIDEKERAEAHAARLSRLFSKEWLRERAESKKASPAA